MPQYEMIGYTRHALARMAQRRIRHEDVELTLGIGDGRPGKRGTWVFEAGSIRVIVREHAHTATVITVIRLRGKR